MLKFKKENKDKEKDVTVAVHNETGNKLISVAVNGFDKKDVDVKIENGVLIIKAEKRYDKVEADREYHGVQTVERKHYVGKDVKKEDLNIAFDNGYVDIEIKK